MTTPELNFKDVGRNAPCPCGSGKKYKKCHATEVESQWQGSSGASSAVSAAQNDSDYSVAESDGQGANSTPQFDPSKMDLNWLAQFSSAIQRLPKGQLQRLQSLMQKAMAGKDVARELEEFQRTLPVNIQELLKNSPALEQQLEDAQIKSKEGAAAAASTPLTDEQKQKLQEIQKSNQKAGLSRLWDRFRKK